MPKKKRDATRKGPGRPRRYGPRDRVELLMSPALLRRLDRRARQLGVSRLELVCRACEELLRREEA